MHFASPFPWWLTAIIGASIVGLAFLAYRRPLAPLARWQQISLASVRAIVLAMLAAILARPAVLVPPRETRDRIVPVLVDVSGSMDVPDAADGRRRIEAASSLLEQLLPELSTRFRPELFTFGEEVAPATGAPLVAEARQSNLTGAVRAVAERYRGRSMAGIVVLTDGAETARAADAEPGAPVAPIVAIGIGGERDVPDREIVGVSAGDPKLDQTAVDVKVSAMSRGFGRNPFQIRVSADGRLVEARRVVPTAALSLVDETFTVSPNPTSPTLVTAEIVSDDHEVILQNNRQSVMVSPAGRKRRVLIVAGAPGYDHSFLLRALAKDPGLEIDLVVRKGKDDEGHDTFLVQAGGGRAASLTSGFPATREALFAYDAVVVANLESEFFSRAQLQSVADFVADRGGGVLVMGALSFTRRGLMGTPLEEVMPVELADRRGASTRASFGGERAGKPNLVALTVDGLAHPVMRIGSSPAETERLWAAMPPLAASAVLGGPRPGATVLAFTSQPGGGTVPLVAVQRYGRGRSAIFGGEGAWRWKMMLPATDRSYEVFWRQAVRWLGGASPEPVAIGVPEGVEPGDSTILTVDARDAAFVPSAEAAVEASITGPAGDVAPISFQRDGSSVGKFRATFRPDRPGLYRVQVRASSGSSALGATERWIHVGGGDRELRDPRLNDGVLRRLAAESGGRYVPAGEVGDIAEWLESGAAPAGAPERRELWHKPWVFFTLVALVALEWGLRRRWGLR